MKSYKALRAQIAKLEQQAETLRRTQVKSVIAQLKKTIAEYGLTAEELGLAAGSSGAARRVRKPAAGKRAGTGVAKYRDPKTGQTWTGRGRPPAWIAEAKDRSAYLIDAPSAAPAAEAAAAPAKARRVRAATKAAAKAAAKKGPGRKTAAKKARGGRRGAAKTPAVQIEGGVAME